MPVEKVTCTGSRGHREQGLHRALHRRRHCPALSSGVKGPAVPRLSACIDGAGL